MSLCESGTIRPYAPKPLTNAESKYDWIATCLNSSCTNSQLAAHESGTKPRDWNYLITNLFLCN